MIPRIDPVVRHPLDVSLDVRSGARLSVSDERVATDAKLTDAGRCTSASKVARTSAVGRGPHWRSSTATGYHALAAPQ
jgi:hypothetical protein